MRTGLLMLFAVALLGVAPAASSDGGPAPGAIGGGDGVLSASGGIRYVAITSGRSTTVAAVEVDGGRVFEYRTFRGVYGIPLVAYDGSAGGLSADGSTLVLAPFYVARQQNQVTHFLVLDVAHQLRPVKRVALRGAFSFDAISPGARTLYLIQYLPAPTYITYRVRAYDLAAGKLVPGSIVDRREPNEKMQGSPVTRATSRDGAWAFTLYARGDGAPFVHALDTRHRRAFCVDLPWRHADQLSLNGIQMRAMRGRVLLSDYAGTLAAIDTHTWRVQSYRKP